MTIHEMHEAVKFRLQRQASNTYASIDDKEIDMSLNVGQLEFIDQMFRNVDGENRRFQEHQKNLDNLRDVIQKNVKLRGIKPTESGYDRYFYEENMFYGFLPADYMYLINARANVEKLKFIGCDEVNTADGNPYKQYIAVLNYKAIEQEICTTNPTFRIDFGADTIFDLSDFGNFRFNSLDNKIDIIRLVLEYLNRFNSASELISYNSSAPQIEISNDVTNFNVYWERYGDIYMPESFIFVTDDRSFILDSTVITPSETDADFNTNNEGMEVSLYTNNSGNPTSTFRFQQRSYNTQVIDTSVHDSSEIQIVKNRPTRIVKMDMLYKTLDYPMGSPTSAMPISTLSNNHVHIYTDGMFLIKDIYIDYIKRPRKLSLDLNQSCELGEHTHTQIVNYAVMNLLNITSNPRYNTHAQDMQLKGQL